MNWVNTDKVWIVNGHVEKTDANFFRDFNLSEIFADNVSLESSQGKLFVGAQPETEIDAIVLQQHNIQAIICLQTKEEMINRKIDWQKMHKMYQSKGVRTIINHPIDDIGLYASEEIRDRDYSSKIFEACQIIHDTITLKKENIFIYDTSGISRSSTIAAAYLALFKKVSFWPNLSKIDEHLKSCHQFSFPNIRVI